MRRKETPLLEEGDADAGLDPMQMILRALEDARKGRITGLGSTEAMSAVQAYIGPLKDKEYYEEIASVRKLRNGRPTGDDIFWKTYDATINLLDRIDRWVPKRTIVPRGEEIFEGMQ
jgi:hypothetical protein